MAVNEQKRWESYEQVAQYIFNEMAEQFNLETVEGKQDVLGSKTGTSYEIDAKGIALHGEGFILVECRCYTTSKQKQEHIAALASRSVIAERSEVLLFLLLDYNKVLRK